MLSGSDVAELAQGVERLGYDMLRYPKGIGYETFNYSGFILAETDRLRAAAGIANICARDALTTISGHDSLSNFYDSRFILGLGVSRVTLAESFCGHDDDKPVTTMCAYLDAMGRVERSIAALERNVVLSASASSSKVPASYLSTQSRIRVRERSWRRARSWRVSPARYS